MFRSPLFFAALSLAAATGLATAEPVDPSLFKEMRWRMIGPHRGGRTKAAVGVPGKPGLYYIGVVNGGVWKTDDFGRTWTPIFDDQPTGSIGAIAIAPSNPNIIYVGSGEGLQRPDLSTGDGIYRSDDAGKTWTHLGLRDGQQIPQIAVDPRDPNRLFVAVLGHPYGPNSERGLFKSTDGGRSFRKVLGPDENTGAVDVVLDPSNPDIVYAALWEARQAPWENGVFSGPGSGAYKSTDGGETWKPIMNGLPTFAKDGLGRIGLTVAPTMPNRLFATAETSTEGWLYRSDDAGASWRRICDDPRVAGRPSDFAEVKVDPKNPDVVYTASVVAWKSTDGGKTFTAWKGAPGGDDYHRIWIDPSNTDIVLIAADQGAVVTVNGGRTWSSWYNQPTAQMYHVITDNAFPYRVCSGQQESGSACVLSRGKDGAIQFRDWTTVGVDEYGYVAPDPLDPEIVYGGRVTRFDRRTGQVKNVAPKPLRDTNYRILRTQPTLFSPVDKKTLYFASNQVWKTTNGGESWTAISGDLTRKTWDVPKNVGKYLGTDAAKPSQRGVVYALGPSPLDINTLWAGTDDGLIHVTHDGGVTWTDVTPPQVGPWAKVSQLDASHFDKDTAYAAVNTIRLDDLRPHIFRTRDSGRTWTRVVSGLPDGATVNVVREDPERRGLLFAGTESSVHVSFDDGDSWTSLRSNMPATSIRDLVIKDDDVVVGTHGRSFWILDDITPLRQMVPSATAASVHLFEPQKAWRVRWNMGTDTPLPPDEPVGENPPDGAIINYWLKDGGGPVTLEIVDGTGALVRRYSSDDKPAAPVPDRNIPDHWIRSTQILASSPGLHRFVFDLHHDAPAPASGYPISAVTGNTWAEPRGPWLHPGIYTVRLSALGQTMEKPLVVRLDPRLKVSDAALRKQYDLSMQMVTASKEARSLSEAIALERKRVETLRGAAKTKAQKTAADRQWAELQTFDSVSRLSGAFLQLLDLLQEVDDAPTTQVVDAIETRLSALKDARDRWARRGSPPPLR